MKGALAVVTGIACLGAAAYVAWDAVIAPLRAEDRATGWVETSCVIDSAELVERRDGSGNTTRHPSVSYHYEVDGRRFEGDRFSFYDAPGDVDRERFGEDYRRGQPVRCYYDPAVPADSVLRREVRRAGRLIVGALCAGAAAIGVVLIAFGVRRRS